MKKIKSLLICFFLSVFCCVHAQPAGDSVSTAQDVVTRLYDLVTFEAGTIPDWDNVRSLFLPEAIVVLRTTRENTTVFTVDGFVDDFINFIERAEAEKTGFKEEIIRMIPNVFGDMAGIRVLYEASIPGSQRLPQQGVDYFSLVKKEGRWLIVSVTNEIPTPERPIPEELKNYQQ